MQNSYKVRTENPPLESLGYVVAIAKLDDKHDRSAPSDHHWKILKCRMIIFSTSSILACPEKKDAKQIHIVFNKLGDDYDKLNSLFIKFSLSQNGAIRIATPEIYQMCFEYTMNAKLAPIWNVVGYHYLINNRDFLTEKGPQNGISYRISADDNETTLEIKPVKINCLRTDEDYLTGEWIRVLPSLNKAVIDEFYETLPEGSFKSYKDLRRHWKNIHGYRLPEEESSYYTVRFWRGDPLTYPKICLVRNFPIITPMPKPAEKTVVSKFIACLKAKIPVVAGRPLIVKGIYETKASVPNTPLPDTQAVSLCTPTQYSCR